MKFKMIILLGILLSLSACGASSIPDKHIEADEAFLNAVEPEFFQAVAAAGTLNGVSVTADMLDLRRDSFDAFRKELQRIKAMRKEAESK